MKMKLKILLFVLFMCIASINLFSADGDGEGPTLSKLDERLKEVENQQANIEKKIEAFTKAANELGTSVKNLSDNVEKLAVSQKQTSVQVPVQTPINPPVKNENINEIRIDDSDSTLTKDKVPKIVNFINRKNPNIPSSVNVQKIIDTYFIEAKKEGINPELAIAQMCYVTRFFKNMDLVTNHNYGGLAPTAGVKASSPDVTRGVRAHIQHLKGYSSNIKEKELKEGLEDPRWYVIDDFRGTVKTLRQLSGRWSPSNMEYETRISKIVWILRGI